MKTICTNCFQELELPDDAAGTTTTCPSCSTQFTADEIKICRHCSAPNAKSASKCVKCGKAIIGIGIRKTGAVSSEAAAAAETTQEEAPPQNHPKIGIRKPGAVSQAPQAPADSPETKAINHPKIGIKKSEMPKTEEQAQPAPSTEEPKQEAASDAPMLNLNIAQKQETSPAPTAPKLNLNVPKGDAPAAGTPKLNLNTPKGGAQTAGAPKLNLNTPKGGAQTAGVPKLNLNTPKPSAAAVQPAQKPAAKQPEKPKEEKKSAGLSDGAKKALKIVAVIVVILGILAGLGVGAFIYLRGPTDPVKQFEKAKELAENGQLEKAVIMLKKSVAQGNKDAIALLGEYYLEGKGVEKNEQKAAELFALAEGNAFAEYHLGLLYAEGKGVKQDFERAAKLFAEASNHGSAEAGSELAKCYAQGLGVKKDEQKAIPWRQKAADGSDAESQYIMAEYLLAGILVPFDPAKAVEYLDASAKQEYKPAQYRLAECMMNGIGMDKNPDQAEKDFAKLYEESSAALKGEKPSPADMLVAAKCLLFGNGTKQDAALAKRILSPLLAQNNAEAITLTASGTKDEKQKIALLNKAAGMDWPDAQWRLAQMLERTDAKQAEKLYQEAKKNGSVSAYAAAAKFHMSSTPKEAFEECKFAADRKNPAGMFLTAECLETGRGTNKDVKQAVDIYWQLAFGTTCEQEVSAQKLASLCTKKEIQTDLINRLKGLLEKGTESEKKQVKKQMGYMSLSGLGMKKDTAAAVKYFEEAGAVNELVGMLRKGIEVKKIIPILSKKAEEGDIELQMSLARLLLEGKAVPPDQKKGLEFMKKAADAGNAEAQYEMGRAYCQDDGRDLVERDPNYAAAKIDRSLANALTYFRKAAGAGHAQAQYRYAKTLLYVKKLPNGIKDRNTEARVWLERAAAAKYVPAEFLLAMVNLESGKKDTKSMEAVFQAIQSAAKNRYAPAMFAMGDIALAAGNTEQAKNWYQKAAAAKYVPALLALDEGSKNKSLMHDASVKGYIPAVAEDGLELLRHDRKGEALKKFDRARKHGYNAVLNASGVCIVTEKKRTAKGYFRDAANHGSQYAAFNLAVLAYKEANLGQGDYETARDMFRKLSTEKNDLQKYSTMSGLIEQQMMLEKKYREVNTRYKEYCSQGASTRVGNQKIKVDASEEEKKKADKMLNELKEIRAKLDKITAEIKKNLEWKIEPNYRDEFRQALPKIRYPWTPAVSLVSLKGVYKEK